MIEQLVHILFFSVDVPQSGISSESTMSAYRPRMSRDVGVFSTEMIQGPTQCGPTHSPFTQQPVPQQPGILLGESNIGVGTDTDHRSIGNEMPWQFAPLMAPSTNGPSLEPKSFASPYFVPQDISGAFQGLVPNTSLKSGFPGSSGAAFEGSNMTSSVLSTFHGLPHLQNTMPGPICLPPTQPTELTAYPSMVAVSNSVFAQQGLPRPPAQLVEMFSTVSQPKPLAPLPPHDSVRLASSTLHLDQQPIRFLAPPPVVPPPQPPLILTSGQPSNLPLTVGSPLVVMPQTPSIELQPVPVLPVPAQFMMEPRPVSVHTHQLSQPGLVTKQSPLELAPSFLPGQPLQRMLAPHVILQEAPIRPPSSVRMPSLVQTGELLLGQQPAISDTTPGQIRLPTMPKSLFDMECHPVGRQLLAPKLAPEFPPELQPTSEPQGGANLRLQDMSDHLSAQLHSELPGSCMLPNQPREMSQQSDRQFSISSKPLMAPGQILEALQGPPAPPQTCHLLGEPSRESLRIGMSPLRVTNLRSHELGRVPNVSLPPIEHDNLSVDVVRGRVEQRVPSLSGSTFSSGLPVPPQARLMAPSQIISSRLPDDRFQSEFQYRDFADEEESESLLEHQPISASMDRVRSSGHLPEFAFASKDISQQLTSDCSHVPSLLDENLLKMSSQSSSCWSDVHASVPTRRWKDRSGDGMMTVGELRAAFQQQAETFQQHGDVNRRRAFHHDEDSAPKFSYEPPRKLIKSAVDTASEAKDIPQASDSISDSPDDKDTVSSSLVAASAAVCEASTPVSSAELS